MPKNTINSGRPTDKQIFAVTRGIPFGTCKQCGQRTTTAKVLCPECERLTEIGFGPVPPQCYPLPGQDTTPVQSYPSNNHSGYSDQIPTGKFPATKKGRA
jgi:hypothetical protein